MKEKSFKKIEKLKFQLRMKPNPHIILIKT